MIGPNFIRIDGRLVLTSELRGSRYHRWAALLLNIGRVWCERWAEYHTRKVIRHLNPGLNVEDAVAATAVAHRFRELRGAMSAASTPQVTEMPAGMNEDLLSLQRMARMVADARARRYTSGRRNYASYEVDHEK